MNIPRVLTPIKQHRNPQCPTTSTPLKNTNEIQQQEKMKELRCLLQTKQYQQALKLFGGNELMQELVLDHIEIAFLDEALFGQSVIGLDFQIVMRQSRARETRIRELVSLRRTRGLNSTVVSSVSSSLREIIAGSFQPFTSLKPYRTQIFQELYSRLNQIAQMVDDSKAKRQITDQEQQTARELLDLRLSLEGKIRRAEEKLNEHKQKEVTLYRQICSLKAEVETLRSIQKEHECQKLQIAQRFNRRLEEKHLEYRQQIQELTQAKYSNERLLKLQNDLQVSVQDFKDLILKLSRENRLLKEQKENLLSKLNFLEQRCLLLVKVSKPTAIHHSSQLSQIADFEEVNLKLRSIEGELSERKGEVRKLEDELSELRRLRTTQNCLDRTISVEESKKVVKFKRTNSNEQGERLSELKQLRKKDQQAIESLTETIEELKDKLARSMVTTKYSSESQDNTLSEEMFLNLKWRDRTTSQKGSNFCNDSIYKQGALQIEFAKEKESNIEQMQPIAVISDLERPREAVMTPRMLLEISQLREQLQGLKEQKKLGDDFNQKCINELRVSINQYEEQMEKLRLILATQSSSKGVV